MSKFETQALRILSEEVFEQKKAISGLLKEKLSFKSINGELFAEIITKDTVTRQKLGGQDGVSITNARIDEGNLVINYSDGREVDLGGISGKDGDSIKNVLIEGRDLVFEMDTGDKINLGTVVGKNGEAGRDGLSIEEARIVSNNLVLKFTDGTYIDCGRVVGYDGTPGQNGSDGLDFPIEEFNRIKSEVNKLTEDVTGLETADKGMISTYDELKKKLDDEINQIKRVLFSRTGLNSGGGGGFAGGNVEKYVGFKKKDIVSSDGNVTITCVYANTFHFELVEDINSIEFKSWPSKTIAQRVILYVKNTGTFTMTGWPANILWSGGEIPIITPNGTDCLVFESFDNGNTIFGNIAGQDYK